MRITNSYAEELVGLYTPWKGAQVPNPKILRFNADLAAELGFPPAWDEAPGTAAVLSGSAPLPGGTPLAQAYAGHQFGHFSSSLGDGRALLIGEVVDSSGQRRDLHLKGSGRTPYSRGGDGKAVLAPVLREYLLGEAMHALGVPTTRGLAVVTTGEEIMREGFQPGAVLARVAVSHLRVGTFQYFAARGDREKLKRLMDYTLARHDPELVKEKDPTILLLRAVVERQTALIAKWMSIGFVHGVMNTDNTTISGETIDYGPCAFVDAYSPGAVYSSIDHHGRYALGNQPAIIQWNMARLAEALLSLVDDAEKEEALAQAQNVIAGIPISFHDHWMREMRKKFGWTTTEESDAVLIQDALDLLEAERVDFTTFFRRLAEALRGNTTRLSAQCADALSLSRWMERFLARHAREHRSPSDAAASMDRTNPLVIPRNHHVDDALRAATANSDLSLFDDLLAAVRAPFDPPTHKPLLAEPPTAGSPPITTFCGT